MVLLGYLWGEGDVMKTAVIATRGGYDSDCNPSSAAGVLGAQLGAKGLGGEFKRHLSMTNKWTFTEYDWPGLMRVCEKLARQLVVAEGGRIGRDAKGEYFAIARKPVVPSRVVDSLKPGPGGDERLTAAEEASLLYLPCKKHGERSVPRCQGAKPQ